MRQGTLDRAAALLSGLCVVHCLAAAILAAALVPLGAAFGHGVHQWGIAFAAPLALLALARAYRLHARPEPLALGVAGLALMASGLLHHGDWHEFALTAPGAALLVTAHLANLRLVRRAPSCGHLRALSRNA